MKVHELKFMFRLPYTVVGSAALIAKFTPQKDQAFMQSLRTFGERFAMILSQNWYANTIIAVTNFVRILIVKIFPINNNPVLTRNFMT